jgi:predicted HAD superfamily Cof-like phosphohydrolase
MDSSQKQVAEFHHHFGQPIGEGPTAIPEERARLRIRLIAEELQEYAIATGVPVRILVQEDESRRGLTDLVEVADALGDLSYVVNGSALEHGIDLEPIVREIHRSNMTKTGAPDAGGKITKGEGYQPPILGPWLEKMAEEPALGPAPRASLERHAHEVGDRLNLALPKGYGFGLFLFSFGEKGNLAWISNADRPSMTEALEEWIGRAKKDGANDPPEAPPIRTEEVG